MALGGSTRRHPADLFNPESALAESPRTRREPAIRPGYGIYHPRPIPVSILLIFCLRGMYLKLYSPEDDN